MAIAKTILALGLAIVSAGCAARSEPPRRVVLVAAAADLKFALEDILEEFRCLHPDIHVEVSYGSSGTLYAQLVHQAPFDLFLSADMTYPRRLVNEGRALVETEFLYAGGQIVLWVRSSSELDVESLGEQVLLDPSVRKIAMANPRHAPYGRAAEAALKSLGVYDRVKDRLTFGDNVAQVAQFVESGVADIGIIALSLALAPSMQSKGKFWFIPREAYPPIEQGGVILRHAKDREAAELVRAFLMDRPARAILQRYGFLRPGE